MAVFPIKETIEKRRSVRSYDGRRVPDELLAELFEYIETVRNPFDIPVCVQVLESGDGSAQKLGTYGVIRGTTQFLAVSVPKVPMAMEAAGYSFEELVLYATHLGLGTCWLAGTFDRKAFTEALNLGENEIMPVISPIGFPAEKRSIGETLMRAGMRSDKRKNWEELFFSGDFATPLRRESAGKFAEPLELLRLAPSATNAQPWRIVLDSEGVHFYARMAVEELAIQRVDLGIAANHFDLAAREAGIAGSFKKLPDAPVTAPEGCVYLFSYMVK